MSGVEPLRVSSSKSVVTAAIGVPRLSRLRLLAKFKCKSVALLNPGMTETELVFPPKPVWIAAKFVLADPMKPKLEPLT